MAVKRKSEISCLNVLLCMLVVFIHIVSFAVSHFEYGTLSYNLAMLTWRAASFVVQGFVLLSGVKMFLTGKDGMPYGKYLTSRIKGVILPYVLSYFIYYLFYFLVYDYPLDIVFILKHLVLGSLVCHFYFIPLLFQFDLLFPVWKRVINNCSPIIIIPFALMLSMIFETGLPSMISNLFPNVSFVYNDRFFTTYLVYWISGCYIGKYYDRFEKILRENFRAICVIFGISFLLFAGNTYLAYNYLAYVPVMNYVHDLYVVSVIIFLYALFLKLPASLPSFVQRTDAVSYDIYLWHMLFVFLANFTIEHFGVQSQLVSFCIRGIFGYGLTVAVCFVLRDIKQRLRKKKGT